MARLPKAPLYEILREHGTYEKDGKQVRSKISEKAVEAFRNEVEAYAHGFAERAFALVNLAKTHKDKRKYYLLEEDIRTVRE